MITEEYEFEQASPTLKKYEKETPQHSHLGIMPEADMTKLSQS